MKLLKGTIIGIVVSGVVISVGALVLKGINSHGSMNHNMASNTTESSDVNHAAGHNMTDNSGQVSVPVKTVETSNVNSNEAVQTDAVKTDDSNSDKAPEDVIFVKYTVGENDTLWKIANTYMPEYNAYPEGDKEGVIAFIVKENNLKKSNGGDYTIYSGQTLTIPKQRDIALTVNTVKNSTTAKSSSNTSVSNTTGTAKQTNNTTSASSSANIKNENSSADSVITTSTNESTQVNQTDHSNHTGHN